MTKHTEVKLEPCPHCEGVANLKIEPTPPPHPFDTTTGEWSDTDESARVECSKCHCQTNSVPKDMVEFVIKRWNTRKPDPELIQALGVALTGCEQLREERIIGEKTVVDAAIKHLRSALSKYEGNNT